VLECLARAGATSYTVTVEAMHAFGRAPIKQQQFSTCAELVPWVLAGCSAVCRQRVELAIATARKWM